MARTSMKRIMSDLREVRESKSPMYTALCSDEDCRQWFFTIRGPPDSDFEGGIYHGRIILPADYPFKPPHIILLTQSGRFQINMKICLSFSAYHPEEWQPAWGIRTILEAIVSFLPSPGGGAVGALDWSSKERKRAALASRVKPWTRPCLPVFYQDHLKEWSQSHPEPASKEEARKAISEGFGVDVQKLHFGTTAVKTKKKKRKATTKSTGEEKIMGENAGLGARARASTDMTVPTGENAGLGAGACTDATVPEAAVTSGLRQRQATASSISGSSRSQMGTIMQSLGAGQFAIARKLVTAMIESEQAKNGNAGGGGAERRKLLLDRINAMETRAQRLHSRARARAVAGIGTVSSDTATSSGGRGGGGDGGAAAASTGGGAAAAVAETEENPVDERGDPLGDALLIAACVIFLAILYLLYRRFS